MTPDPPVGVVDLAPPVGVVDLAPPVGVVDLALPVDIVYLALPVGVADLAPPVKGFSCWVTSTAKVKSTSILKSVKIGPNHFFDVNCKVAVIAVKNTH